MRPLTQFGKRLERGFTVVEIMIAMTIALFLLAGLMTIVGSTRNAFGKTTQLSLLQDNERMALTFISDIVQQAGYYPNALTPPAPTAFTPLNGQYNVNAQGDTITVQFQTGINPLLAADGVLNCSGLPNTSGGTTTYTNTFSITSGGVLNCRMFDDTSGNTVDYPLVSGLQKMDILYGVHLSGSCANCVETYINATDVTNNALWPNVLSVQITLTFSNPLYALGQDKQPATIAVQRVVAVMNKGGKSL